MAKNLDDLMQEVKAAWTDDTRCVYAAASSEFASKTAERVKSLSSDPTAPQPRDLEQGVWEGKVRVANDFDALPEELLSAFLAEEDIHEPPA